MDESKICDHFSRTEKKKIENDERWEWLFKQMLMIISWILIKIQFLYTQIYYHLRNQKVQMSEGFVIPHGNRGQIHVSTDSCVLSLEWHWIVGNLSVYIMPNFKYPFFGSMGAKERPWWHIAHTSHFWMEYCIRDFKVLQHLQNRLQNLGG